MVQPKVSRYLRASARLIFFHICLQWVTAYLAQKRENYISSVISLSLERDTRSEGHHLRNNKGSKEREFALSKLDPNLPCGDIFIPLNWVCLF